jgi:hypothetical protein
MYAAYVFSLVLGGGFLLVSVLGDILGGDASDVALDGPDIDVDLDVHMDVDVDMDVDTDIDVHGDVAHHGDMALVSKVFSFRMVVYTLFGFGAVGWLMTQAGLAPAAPLTIASSVFGGVASGALVQSVFNYLKRTDSGGHVGEDSFVGLPGVVTLPLGGNSPGNVAVEIGGRRVTLRALPHGQAEDDVLRGWKNVVVVEMQRGVARVAPVDQDLRALTDGDA